MKENAATPFRINLPDWPLLTFADDHEPHFHVRVGRTSVSCFSLTAMWLKSPRLPRTFSVSGVSLMQSNVGCRVLNAYGGGRQYWPRADMIVCHACTNGLVLQTSVQRREGRREEHPEDKVNNLILDIEGD